VVGETDGEVVGSEVVGAEVVGSEVGAGVGEVHVIDTSPVLFR